jgi:hypothetical protein
MPPRLQDLVRPSTLHGTRQLETVREFGRESVQNMKRLITHRLQKLMRTQHDTRKLCTQMHFQEDTEGGIDYS